MHITSLLTPLLERRYFHKTEGTHLPPSAAAIALRPARLFSARLASAAAAAARVVVGLLLSSRLIRRPMFPAATIAGLWMRKRERRLMHAAAPSCEADIGSSSSMAHRWHFRTNGRLAGMPELWPHLRIGERASQEEGE